MDCWPGGCTCRPESHSSHQVQSALLCLVTWALSPYGRSLWNRRTEDTSTLKQLALVLKCLYEWQREWTIPKFIFSIFPSLTYTKSKAKVNLSLCTALRHMGSSSSAPLFLQLGTRWRWVANCMPQPPPPWYPPNEKLFVPPQSVWLFWRQKDIMPLPGVEAWISQSRALSLYRLSCWAPI